MLDQVSSLACTGGKDEAKGAKQWEAFTSWLGRRGKGAFDVIIDGANVGYYKNNFPGKFDV